ncbi:LPXTG cell wall anchor domain-containing protein [Enterococcus sp. JM9B]|uniref:LPXTG cell wall anchor domain-containing protein n=1 Tax=Enterococcus sp. JM9B TaxID=1857216 RepID=UPI001374F452|nr:LPXTG cell wall anchor domain-containing protein [Enterococcus sp. JM9B]KAF1303370.1 hypothetical protein BAU16_04775 [Enterococcus sp. JM9B]
MKKSGFYFLLVALLALGQGLFLVPDIAKATSKTSTAEFTVVPTRNGDGLSLPESPSQTYVSTQKTKAKKLPKTAEAKTFLAVVIGSECLLLAGIILYFERNRRHESATRKESEFL